MVRLVLESMCEAQAAQHRLQGELIKHGNVAATCRCRLELLMWHTGS